MAQKNGVALGYAGVEALRVAYSFTDLQSFLDLQALSPPDSAVSVLPHLHVLTLKEDANATCAKARELAR